MTTPKNSLDNRLKREESNSKVILLAVLLFVFVLLGYHTFQYGKSTQKSNQQYALLTDISHGMFSIHEWKDQLTLVLFAAIDQINLRTDDKRVLAADTEQFLYGTINTVQSSGVDMLDQYLGSWNWAWEKGYNVLLYVTNLFRADVPAIVANLIDQFTDGQSMDQLKSYLKHQIDVWMAETYGERNDALLANIVYELRAESMPHAIQLLDQSRKESRLWAASCFWFLLLCSMAILQLIRSWRDVATMTAKNIVLVVFLLLGVTLPMITLEAQIESFSFTLIGHDISFTNQTLFSQSKSILNVISVLFQTKQFSSFLVALLILTFSILFPLSKLIASFQLEMNQTSPTKLQQFLVYKSSKWSMADVFVVALFMAFIGFNGVLDSQLAKLNNGTEWVSLISTNSTRLEVGMLCFVAFVGISFHTSHTLKKRLSHAA